MSHDEIIDFITDLYKRMPNVKEYLDLAYTNEYDKFIEKNRKKIERYLYPSGSKRMISYKEALQLILEINRMDIPEVSYQLEFYYVEYATEVVRDYGYFDDKFYSSIVSMFYSGIKNINKIDGYEKNKDRIDTLISNAYDLDIELDY